MPTDFDIDSELSELCNEFMTDAGYPEFKSLRDCEIKVRACLKIKHDKDENLVPAVGNPSELKKVSPLNSLFLATRIDYILVVDKYFWHNAPDMERRALVHKGLMRVYVDPESGKIKSRAPEIVEYAATVVRYGTYSANLKGFRDVLLGVAEAARTSIMSIHPADGTPVEDPPDELEPGIPDVQDEIDSMQRNSHAQDAA